MAVGFESVVSAQNHGGSSLTTPAIVPAGADRYLLCGVTTTAAVTVSGVNKGVSGTAFTQIAVLNDAVNDIRIELFELKDPSTTSEVIEVILSGADNGFSAGCCAFSGVNQTTPIQTNETASGQGDPTRAVAGATDGFGMMVFSLGRDLNYAATAGTERWDHAGDEPSGGGITEVGATTITMTADYAQNRNWVLAAVAIAASGLPPVVMGVTTEAATAPTFDHSKGLNLGVTTGVGTAPIITPLRTRTIGVATGVGSAPTFDHSKGLNLGVTTETDTAPVMFIPGDIILARARRSVSGIWHPGLIPGVTPDATKPPVWRWASGWSFTERAPPVGVGLVVEIGVASEADTAPTLQLRVALKIAAETDSAPVNVPLRTRTIGVSTEVDSAPALGRLKVRSINVTSETDTAPAVVHSKQVPLGVTTEVDSAPTITPAELHPFSVASEVDSAPAMVHSKAVNLSVAPEADSAPAIVPDRARTFGISTEVDSAPTFDHSKTLQLNVAAEVDVAPVLAIDRAHILGVSTGVGSAPTITAIRVRALNVASETDSASTFDHSKAILLGVSTEVDFAPRVLLPVPMDIAPEVDSAPAMQPNRDETFGVASEVDSAPAMAHPKGLNIGVATETDAAFDLVADRAHVLGLASEVDSAPLIEAGQSQIIFIGVASEVDDAPLMAHPRVHVLGVATEVDIALIMQPNRDEPLGIVSETDVALAMAHPKTLLLGVTTEVDTAPAITLIGPVPAKIVGRSVNIVTTVRGKGVERPETTI